MSEYLRLILFVLLLHYGVTLCLAQVTSTTSDLKPPVQVIYVQEKLNKILADSGVSFREGLQLFRRNKRIEAGVEFDKSIESFLYSDINIQKEQKLASCYNQLIETVYRIEFPSVTAFPRIRELSSTCGWTWNNEDLKLADDIVSMIKPAEVSTAGLLVGFNEQQFEASSLEGLAKLELTIDQRGNSEKISLSDGVQIVRARLGDTVATVAGRYSADPTEVAKYNGLLPDSVLGSGREIKIPKALGDRETRAFKSQINKGRCNEINSPTVQGLNLGISSDKAAIILKRKLRLKKRSEDQEYITSIFDLKGLDGLGLVFYKDVLYQITALYDRSIQWSGITEFQNAVSKSMGIRMSWDSVGFGKELTCWPYFLAIKPYSLGRYTVAISNLEILMQISREARARRDAAEEKRMKDQQRRKQAFKP